MTEQLCQECQQPMELLEPGFFFHPNCIPAFTPVPGMHGMSFYDLEIKEDFIEIIRWSNKNARRSQQVKLGCSEVGHDCDRRIAYTMAGIKGPNNHTDQWPAIVGTSIHAWMAEAFEQYQQVHGLKQWLMELEVHPSPLIGGHSDLYDSERQLVLDWKFPSPDNLKKMRENGPSAQYMTQVQLYGLGNILAGRPVTRVGVVALGRQGWLKDMYVHTVEFDRGAAEAALQRVYDLGNQLISLDILNQPGAWAQIPASPSRLCLWCPFYARGTRSASDTGCPGKNET